MVDLALLNGVRASPHTVVVQVPCRILEIDAAAFRDALVESQALHDHLLRYAQGFTVQLAQASLCNTHFTSQQRLARWLLMCHDRADREDLTLTLKTFSLMLVCAAPG